MGDFVDLLSPDSEFWEACARHTIRQTTRFIGTIYLCDECAYRLTKEGLNERPPIYHGETVNGFCGLCNRKLDVTLRAWFACPMCWNVILAYQKGLAASEGVRQYWENSIINRYPDFEL